MKSLRKRAVVHTETVTKRRIAKGRSHPITAEWKAAVRSKLEEFGWTHDRLNREVRQRFSVGGKDKSWVSVMLSDRSEASRYAVYVADILGVPLGKDSPAIEDVLEMFRAMESGDPERFIHWVTMLRRDYDARRKR